ncbi:replication restart helicase PriA [Singulisphaera acidiphila]|uniref:Replication restart protein PriA n=1 Tax=Singulisphaera acidiphila (strain ATCC BAA-1392 / DSM 18658 / VKM B-2454 / MOB10) TaxID=886293 RepID=L0DQS6_SINAD|nr:primosomal protein N' [Singulisphaera acidiphila]AGA31330.1 primosomal protein N'' [Singulisphaera acidiphila DSM 18658]
MSLVNGKRQADWFADEAGTDADGPYAGIVFNRPIDQIFSYRVPARLEEVVRPGQRVRVPLGRGNKPAVGYCVRIDAEAPSGIDPSRVKEVLDVLDDPPLINAAMLELTRWMAGYYACSWGQALDAVVPAGVKNQAGTRVGTFLTVPDEIRKSLETLELPTKQAEALAVLCRSDEPLTIADLCRLAKCASGPITALRQRGYVNTVRRRLPKDAFNASSSAALGDDSDAKPIPALTVEQTAVMAAMTPALEGDEFATFLIHGVTGSGKTEVYLSAIERVMARGREAIVLVPEISLTPQTIRRFRRRFGKIAVLHSHLSDAERHRHWRSIAAGEVQVIVGARSAVFAPARRLGLIVIDEEHESTFKQETTPRYHARDVAVKRAQLERIPILLGSATPALETWRNAELGRYVRLPMMERVGARPMPKVELIDLSHERLPLGGLSEPLRQAMIAALKDDGQVMLLLNRRGFHTFVICPNPRCNQVLKCHACDVALTYHKGRRLLICHTCDAERPRPSACPNCQAPNLHYGGIGTERLEREVEMAFPDSVSRRMDSDTMRTPGSHEQVLAAFRSGEIKILLGTQMIAKGLDFPNVTLVGVVNADTALHMPDFRAAERTFQLVAQVAGRTGRGDRPGRVLVQTFAPDHYAIDCASRHDYEGFVACELPERQRFGMPPFGRLVRLIGRGPDEPQVRTFMNELLETLKAAALPGVTMHGPAPTPISKIRNLYRYHLRLRSESPRPLQTLLQAVAPSIAPPGEVELAIDVDPVNLL